MAMRVAICMCDVYAGDDGSIIAICFCSTPLITLCISGCVRCIVFVGAACHRWYSCVQKPKKSKLEKKLTVKNTTPSASDSPRNKEKKTGKKKSKSKRNDKEEECAHI